MGYPPATLGGSGWVVPNIDGQPAKYVYDAFGNITGLAAQEGKTSPLSFKSGPKIAILGNSIVSQGAAISNIGGTYTSWVASTVFSTSAVGFPKFHDYSGGINAIKWVATTGGTTGATEPAWKWSDPVGTTYTDGTVIWTAQAETQTPWCCWAWGYWNMAQALSGQLLDEVCVAGRSGEQSSTILPYLDRALATNPDVVAFFNMFENDCWPGAAPTLATIATNWNAFVVAADRVRGMGKRVMISTVLPNANIDASSIFTGYSAGNGTKAWMWLNQKIREYARARPDVILWDCATVYVDPNVANPVWPENSTTYTSQSGSGQQLKGTDGVHPYKNFGWKLAKALSPILTANFPARTIFNPAGDTWQLAPNPLMFGTAGTRNATIGSGTIPNTLTGDAFGSTAGSTSSAAVARTDISGNFASIVGVAATAVGGDAISISTSSLSLGAFAVGDQTQMFLELKILANPTLLMTENLRYRFGSAASQWVYSSVIQNTDQDEAASFTSDTLLTLKSPPVLIPSGTANVLLYGRAEWRGVSSITAQFGRMAVKFVTQKTTPV